MNKVGGKIILWGLILGMLAFTAIRTIHFLQLTFPPDQRYVAYLGLVAFDVGVLGWFYYATHSAEGAAQRAVAYGMIFVCSAGVIATTIADMTIVSSENGLAKIPPDVGILGLWAVIIVIVLNFLAGIIVHLVDPNHQKHFEMQNAKDVIHSTTMQHIKQRAHEVAPRIAQQVSSYWEQQVIAEMTGQLPGIRQQSQLAPPTVNSTAQSLPQTGELPAFQQPQQKDGFFSKVGKWLGGNEQPVQEPPRQRTDEELLADLRSRPGFSEWFTQMERERAKEAQAQPLNPLIQQVVKEWADQPQNSPLHQPHLTTDQANQTGSNGKQ